MTQYPPQQRNGNRKRRQETHIYRSIPPNFHIGRIIGKKGATLTIIKKRSGCQCEVKPLTAEGETPARFEVEISYPNEQRLQECIRILNEIIHNSNQAPVQQCCVLPDNCAGIVLRRAPEHSMGGASLMVVPGRILSQEEIDRQAHLDQVLGTFPSNAPLRRFVTVKHVATHLQRAVNLFHQIQSDDQKRERVVRLRFNMGYKHFLDGTKRCYREDQTLDMGELNESLQFNVGFKERFVPEVTSNFYERLGKVLEEAGFDKQVLKEKYLCAHMKDSRTGRKKDITRIYTETENGEKEWVDKHEYTIDKVRHFLFDFVLGDGSMSHLRLRMDSSRIETLSDVERTFVENNLKGTSLVRELSEDAPLMFESSIRLKTGTLFVKDGLKFCLETVEEKMKVHQEVVVKFVDGLDERIQSGEDLMQVVDRIYDLMRMAEMRSELR